MSDIARLQLALRVYDTFVKAMPGCANATQAGTVNGGMNCTLLSQAGLHLGGHYSISAPAGIQPGTTFRYRGVAQVTLSQPATATGTQNATITPYTDLL